MNPHATLGSRISLSILTTTFAFGMLTSTATLAATSAAQPKVEESGKPAPQPVKDCPPVTRFAEVLIDGKKIPYQATAAKLTIEKDDGSSKASIFHVSYERTDIKDRTQRPVMFAFNGGPGSSAVWLHIGMLGPKALRLGGDGTQAPMPPVRVSDNPDSILDACDLVFIDPVSTGYSRAEKDTKDDEFHGVNADIESVGEFIRRWVTEHKRWGSPKYLLGESYGGIRAAGLSSYLQTRHGMSLNGVVMLSTLLDFRTLSPTQGNDLSYSVFLPAFTSIALHHGKLSGDFAQLSAESRNFAFGTYADALLKGTSISDDEKNTIAERLSGLSGISKDIWLRYNLRLDPDVFQAELLRDRGLVIGRFDARIAAPAQEASASSAEYDPSYSYAYGAFSTAMLDYLSRDLGYTEDKPYEILTNKVIPWSWDSNNRQLNVSDRLVTAMRDNPKLRVLVMTGHADLATPAESMAFSIRQMLRLPVSLRGNIRTVDYQAGHMFYLNPSDLAKARKDLLDFIR